MNFFLIKRVIFCGLIFLLGAMIGCSSGKAKSEEWNVTALKAQEMWEKQEVIIIDVRTPEEYDQGHIPGVLFIPLDELKARLGEFDKEKKVLVICRSGNRSRQATEFLRNKDYTNVYNITEGMNGWKGPLENKK